MDPRSRPFRALTSVILCLQALVAGGGPLVDARLEASENQAVVHVESESSRACAAGHDHLFCQVCRAISFAAGPAPATTQVPDGLTHRRPARVAQPAPAAPWLLVRAHGPRAPPAFSA